MVHDRAHKHLIYLVGSSITVFCLGLTLFLLKGVNILKSDNILSNWSVIRYFSTNSTTVHTLPLIYVVTPTYYRHTQFADITRLSNTLVNVKSIHWIVIEDGLSISQDIQSFLNSTGIKFTYFNVTRARSTKKFLKGVDQRNAALKWIRKNHDQTQDAVVYFADDDNSYNLKLFDEMRYTKKISMWPVGLVGGRSYEAPLCDKGKVVGFDAWFSGQREFAVDMAGFALNVKVLFYNPKMQFAYNAPAGFQESNFLSQCCTIDDIEPKANCTKIYVWHTRTQKPMLKHR